MAVQTDFTSKAFEQMFDNFRKAAESTFQMQQDLVGQWAKFWPGLPKSQPPWADKAQEFYKEWTHALADLSRKCMDAWERQYRAGIESLEEAFRMKEIDDPEELRRKVTELWQKSFACLKDLAESQVRTFQAGMEKWMELAKKARP